MSFCKCEKSVKKPTNSRISGGLMLAKKHNCDTIQGIHK